MVNRLGELSNDPDSRSSRYVLLHDGAGDRRGHIDVR